MCVTESRSLLFRMLICRTGEAKVVSDGSGGKLLIKKICFVSPVSIHSYRWIEAFYQKRYDVSLITDARAWIDPNPINIPVYVLPTLKATNLHNRLIPNYASITRILRKIKPDLVNLHMQHHYGPALILNRMPFVLTSWGFEVLSLPHTDPFRKTLAKSVAMKAYKITVDAERLKQIWTKIGIPENKIEVIPFGVDLDLFNPKIDGTRIRKKLGIKQNDIVITSTRPYFTHYNLECLIKAIPLILDRHRNVKFIIKGAGQLENYLKDMAKKLDVFKSIHFLEPVPYNEIGQYLKAADIYVSTSFIDSTSVSLLEAMACGLPPVTTDIAGNREWIKNEVNGLLYPPKDHKALTEKIMQLVENEDLRKQFGERSVQIIKEKASWAKCVSKMEAIYQSLAIK